MNKIWRLLSVVVLALGLGAAALLARPGQPIGVRAGLEGMPAAAGQFERVTGPAELSFPADFGAHPDTQTEWWYFTGNLRGEDGRRFGFQLTFFRRGLAGPDVRAQRSSNWAANQVYLAHFALTDVQGGAFKQFERIERGAAGLAGASGNPAFEVWLRDWAVVQTGEREYRLRAHQDQLGLDLNLTDKKGPILQGERGYSQKGPEAGNASTYVSLTRLEAAGSINLDGNLYEVNGTAWMDHEYGTSALGQGQTGWDWFSIQLEDGRELMVYTIRRADGSIDPFSRGALIEVDGSIRTFSALDFSVIPSAQWKSPHSGGIYPAEWTIRIDQLDLDLQIAPVLADQELNNSFVYWEGAVDVTGSQRGRRLRGWGYTELTGYARSFEGGF